MEKERTRRTTRRRRGRRRRPAAALAVLLLLASFSTAAAYHILIRPILGSLWGEPAAVEKQLPEDGGPDKTVDAPPPEAGEPGTTPEDGQPGTVPVDPLDWNLTLVNPWNQAPEGREITLTTLKNGLQVDERCYPALQEMMDACRAAGLSPVICSAYRSLEKQQSLYDNKVDRLMGQGYSREDALREAAEEVAFPGTSEHQLGLAVDIVDLSNQNLDETQEDTPVQKWLMEHCWEYGFILRYPNEKSEVTGIIYEPWHYRYVGKEAAAEIRDLDLCLEEYLEQLTQK